MTYENIRDKSMNVTNEKGSVRRHIIFRNTKQNCGSGLESSLYSLNICVTRGKKEDFQYAAYFKNNKLLSSILFIFLVVMDFLFFTGVFCVHMTCPELKLYRIWCQC